MERVGSLCNSQTPFTMSQAPFIQPPRTAGWFVDLFIPNEQAESIPGELLEECSDLASKSGFASARRWYCRQSAKTIDPSLSPAIMVQQWSGSCMTVIGGLIVRETGSAKTRRPFASR